MNFKECFKYRVKPRIKIFKPPQINFLKMIIPFAAIFLIIFVDLLIAPRCNYKLQDKRTRDDPRKLYTMGLRITIAGETSYTNLQATVDDCKYITEGSIRPRLYFYSVSKQNKYCGCCETQILRCQYHRKTDKKTNETETALQYLERTLRHCKMMYGYVSEVTCRFSTKQQRNIIIQIELHDKKPNNSIILKGCKIGKKYATYWNGSPILINTIIAVDLFSQKIKSKDPYPFNVIN
ncbi:hypothetical protein HZS_3459 [Henneguya salminicola]|nr:hypothetical protein HZS_3459 [Henneguya salminicola]